MLGFGVCDQAIAPGWLAGGRFQRRGDPAVCFQLNERGRQVVGGGSAADQPPVKLCRRHATVRHGQCVKNAVRRAVAGSLLEDETGRLLGIAPQGDSRLEVCLGNGLGAIERGGQAGQAQEVCRCPGRERADQAVGFVGGQEVIDPLPERGGRPVTPEGAWLACPIEGVMHAANKVHGGAANRGRVAALVQEARPPHQHEQEAIGEAVRGLRRSEMPRQAVEGHGGQNGHMTAVRAQRVFSGHGAERLPVPRLAQDFGQDIPLARRLLQDAREFAFGHQQPLVDWRARVVIARLVPHGGDETFTR